MNKMIQIQSSNISQPKKPALTCVSSQTTKNPISKTDTTSQEASTFAVSATAKAPVTLRVTPTPQFVSKFLSTKYSNSIVNLFSDLSSWIKICKQETEKPYFIKLSHVIDNEYENSTVFPLKKNIFRAFELCSFDSVKVVIVGQDPYHKKHQAQGLAFSVNNNIVTPPSLRNIHKELLYDMSSHASSDIHMLNKNLKTDSNFGKLKNTINSINLDNLYAQNNLNDLSFWAKQGVLLLNTSLTVKESKPNSHANIGWEIFTDSIIKLLSNQKNNVVFILWGKNAMEKKKLIDNAKHHIIESAHPSPLSAYRGFFGSKPFSKTNEHLLKHKLGIINWL